MTKHEPFFFKKTVTMKKFSTLLNLAAVMLLASAWSGSVWAQDALQLSADATQVTQDFDGMWDSNAQAATLDMVHGTLLPAVYPAIARWAAFLPPLTVAPAAST